MRAEDIYQQIIDKRDECDEDPLEYNESAMPNKLIYIGWILGKGYIAASQADVLLCSIVDGDLDEFYQLPDHMYDLFGVSFDTSYKQISEFIASVDTYERRFNLNFE